jgi:hypothetical protein
MIAINAQSGMLSVLVARIGRITLDLFAATAANYLFSTPKTEQTHVYPAQSAYNWEGLPMPDSKNIQQLSFNFGSPEEGCCGGDCHSEPEDTQGVQAEPAPEDTDAELQEDGDQ